MTNYRPRHWTKPQRAADTRPTARDRGYDHAFQQARKIVLEQERECALCGRAGTPEDVVDHVLPVRAGGTSQRDNLQRLCRKCNAAKAVIDNGHKRTPNNPNMRRDGVMV